MSIRPQERVTLIGLGAIGISFASLHLKHSESIVSVYDPRPDLESHLQSVLPVYLDAGEDNASLSVASLLSSGRLRICSSLESACTDATIVQEQGPENLAFKKSTWAQVVRLVSPITHLWSSTSGIAASLQGQDLDASAQSRLLVVHPFNPPHLMPLLEIVPSPHTSAAELDFARAYFAALHSGHRPVVLHRERPGFVANRLAFILFREACHLVADGVVSVRDLDTIVEASLGLRWAVTGPFKAYNYGGGAKGLDSFLANLSGTIQEIWNDAGVVNFGENSSVSGEKSDAETWRDRIVRETKEAYGLPTALDLALRDRALKQVLRVQQDRENTSAP